MGLWRGTLPRLHTLREEAPSPDEVEAYVVLQECLEMIKKICFSEVVAPWDKEEEFQTRMIHSRSNDDEPICPTPISFYIPIGHYIDCNHIADNPKNERWYAQRGETHK
ncbi:hypothetical protein JHK87_027694 [Glycine soja]|nr:hypothetical protein JHK87_027694 [Glycine soja]